MKSLKQRKNLSAKEFVLTANGIKIQERFVIDSTEYTIPFEKIANSEIVTTKNKSGWLVVSLLFFALACIIFFTKALTGVPDNRLAFVWLFLAFVCYLMYYFSKINLRIVQCYDNQNIVFYNNKPNKDLLDDFIKDIYKARKNYFLNKFVNPSFTADEKMRTLSWLYDQNIINLEEFNAQKKLITDKLAVGF